MAHSMASKFDAPIIKVNEINDHIFLDAREIEEYSVSHIKGSIHIGYNNFNLEETLQKIPIDKKVIVYCSVGYRSGEIAQKLRKKSIKAYNLYGGFFNWVNLKRPIVDGKNNPTLEVHGYNKSWSKWIKEGEVILPSKKSIFNFWD